MLSSPRHQPDDERAACHVDYSRALRDKAANLESISGQYSRGCSARRGRAISVHRGDNVGRKGGTGRIAMARSSRCAKDNFCAAVVVRRQRPSRAGQNDYLDWTPDFLVQAVLAHLPPMQSAPSLMQILIKYISFISLYAEVQHWQRSRWPNNQICWCPFVHMDAISLCSIVCDQHFLFIYLSIYLLVEFYLCAYLF